MGVTWQKFQSLCLHQVDTSLSEKNTRKLHSLLCCIPCKNVRKHVCSGCPASKLYGVVTSRGVSVPHQPPPMTAEAKAERREAALKAAESRNKDWDKRLNKGREASLTKPKGANGGVSKFREFE